MPIILPLVAAALLGQTPAYKSQADALRVQALKDLGALQILTDLTNTPHEARKVNAPALVDWAKTEMTKAGLDNVHVQPGKTPEWQRGAADSCLGVGEGVDLKLPCQAIQDSPPTSKTGLIGEVVEVKSLAQAKQLGEKAKGAVIFFNAPANPDYITGDKFIGENIAAGLGASAVIIRSTSAGMDDVAHPAAADFDPAGKRVPVAVVSLGGCAKLVAMLKAVGTYHVQLILDTKMVPEVPSNIVLGQITGADSPQEVVLLGGHIDSVSKVPPTRNDGVGAAESIEALRLLKELGWKPKRTIRVVVWVDEDRGGSGAKVFADSLRSGSDKVIAAVGTDELGFEPKGYGISSGTAGVTAWQPFLAGLDVDHFSTGGDPGADVALLKPSGAVLVTLEPKAPRSFDYHRADKFVLSKVNSNDLEIGAASLAMLSWLIAQEGIK